ncbi:MAG: bifunctional nuclease domain-containing protein [Rudaea sp.]
MQTRSDLELVALARSGDGEAFGELAERYRPMVRRIASRMVAAEGWAEDLSQETLLQAFLSLDRLRDDARFVAWLYGIALNVCRTWVRSSRHVFSSRVALEGGLELPRSADPVDPYEQVESREERGHVLRAIDELSVDNREATLLFYFEGLDLKETAQVLGISVAAVKGRLFKSRHQLRAKLVAADEGTAPLSWPSERGKMRKVRIADVVKTTPSGGEPEETGAHYVVILVDEERRRALPIWIGPWEGQSIAVLLRGGQMPRPLTYQFIDRLLQAAGATLEHVRIQALKGDVFYAVARLRIGDQVREIDARPSDALALAAQTGAEVFADDDVMNRAGAALQEGKPLAELGRGMEAIARRFEEERQAAVQTGKKQTPEEIERGTQDVLVQLFRD